MNCLVCNTPISETGMFARCPSCGLVKILSPITYSPDDYTKTYRNLYDTDLEKRINWGRVATLMRFVPTGGKILDYGCSCGNFLKRAEQHYRCEGYEPSPDAKTARTCVSSIYGYPGQISIDYDAITLFDVFEHFDNPDNATRFLVNSLKPRGYLIVVGPNPENQVLSEFYHVKPGEHAFLWTIRALNIFLTKCGLGLVTYNYDEGWLRSRNGDTTQILTAVFQRVSSC